MTVPAANSDKVVPADVRIVEMSIEPVALYKILKFAGMVASGGQAKAVVAAGQVLVNGQVATQKRKKIVGGDVIEFGNEKIGVKLAIEGTAIEGTAIEGTATEGYVPKAKTIPVVKERTAEATKGRLVTRDTNK